MIITEKVSPKINTIEGESQVFRIATNAKAFRVLVDGIYSDKIGSIVRELLSNAWDAHARRGDLDLPFEVRLPNALNPTFSVRDYGCSMEHEFVLRSYSTLFESSKGDSNTEVGAFGLGAKSFLSYTDACTLVCWLDGEVRSYSIALNDDAVPEVKLVHRAPSDEPQGVEVTFAVAQGDFQLFRRAAETCSYGFDVPPNFVGNEITPLTPVFTGTGWRVYDSRISNIDSQVIVRQGCAVYPTNRYNYNTNLPHNYVVVVDAPIGTIGVTASREALALSPEQGDQLRYRVTAAVLELNGQVQEQYRALTTPIAKARFAYANSSLLGRGDFPTWVKLPFSVNKWDAGALAPYDVFNVSYLDKILVIHDDGTPIKRRTLRLRSLVKQGRKSVYLVTSSAEVQKIRTLLDLSAGQVVKIEAIPDVHVNRSGGGTAAPKKVVTNDVVWANSNRQAAWAGEVLTWNRRTEHVGRFYGASLGWTNNVIHEASNGKPILYLTVNEMTAALKAGRITEDMRLDNVIKRALGAAKMEDTLYSNLVHTMIGNRTYQQFVRDEMVKRSGVSLKQESLPAAELFGRFFPERSHAINKRAEDTVQKLAGQFPLLFGYDRNAAEAYIKMCDKTGQKV
jgi:hypothetical protein